VRVVLDTNVLISGLLWHGAPHDLIEQARASRIEVVSSAVLVREFLAVVRRRKFRSALARSGTDAERLRRELECLIEVIDPPPAVQPTSRDSDDDEVLAVAVAGRVDFIVSGDNDLLVLRSHAGIPIIDPVTALERTKS
jgi:putative PIN family toxin of toxin-antitoxin system